MGTIGYLFLVVVGMAIGAAAIVVLQSVVRANATLEETEKGIDNLREQVQHTWKDIAKTRADLAEQGKAHDEWVDRTTNRLRAQADMMDTLRDWLKRELQAQRDGIGELDVRYQVARDGEREIVNRVGSVEDITRDLEDRVITLEARVAHRKRTPKEANPTDGTTDPSEPGPDNPDYTVAVGDFEPLNPTIFKEVASSFIDK